MATCVNELYLRVAVHAHVHEGLFTWGSSIAGTSFCPVPVPCEIVCSAFGVSPTAVHTDSEDRLIGDSSTMVPTDV